MSSIAAVLGCESQRRVAVVSRAVVAAGRLASEVARQRSDGVDVFVLDAETDGDVARAFALLGAKAFVSREDVLRALPLAATHRVIMGFEAELEGVQVSDVLKGVLERVK